MNDLPKAAVILGSAIIVAVAISIYFSPYHACVRALQDASSAKAAQAAIICAKETGR